MDSQLAVAAQCTHGARKPKRITSAKRAYEDRSQPNKQCRAIQIPSEENACLYQAQLISQGVPNLSVSIAYLFAQKVFCSGS